MNQEKHKVTLQYWKPINPDEITKADLPIEGVRVRDNEVTKWSPPKNLTGVKIGEAEMPFIVSHIPWKFCEQLITEELPDFNPIEGLPPYLTREDGTPWAMKGDGKRIKGWCFTGSKWRHHTQSHDLGVKQHGRVANKEQAFIPDITDERVKDLAPEQYCEPETWAALQEVQGWEIIVTPTTHPYLASSQTAKGHFDTYQAAAEAILAASEGETPEPTPESTLKVGWHLEPFGALPKDSQGKSENLAIWTNPVDEWDYERGVGNGNFQYATKKGSPQWKACRAAEEKTPCEQLSKELPLTPSEQLIKRAKAGKSMRIKRKDWGESWTEILSRDCSEPNYVMIVGAEGLISIHVDDLQDYVYYNDGTPVIANPNQQD